jgi:hypothetical protein
MRIPPPPIPNPHNPDISACTGFNSLFYFISYFPLYPYSPIALYPYRPIPIPLSPITLYPSSLIPYTPCSPMVPMLPHSLIQCKIRIRCYDNVSVIIPMLLYLYSHTSFGKSESLIYDETMTIIIGCSF